MKRILNQKIHFFIALSTIFLTSCNSLPYRPVYPFNLGNIAFNIFDPRDFRASVSSVSSPESSYQIVSDSLTHLERGFAEILDSSSQLHGTFSCLSGKAAVPAKYTSLVYYDEGEAGTYVFGVLPLDSNSSWAKGDFYDYRGNLLASGLPQTGFSFDAVTFMNSYQKKCVAERIKASTMTQYSEVLPSGTRISLGEPPFSLAKFSDGEYVPFHSTLSSINLSNYTGNLYPMGWFRTINSADKSWVDFLIPSRMDHYAFFSKALFYQNVVESTGDYDYEEGGKKYQLSTHQIALVNGQDTSLNFPFKIDELRPVFDESHIALYGWAKIHPILNHQLRPAQIMIFRNNGGVLSDVTDNPLYSFDLSVLDAEHFLDCSTGAIVDGTYKVTQTLPSIPHDISYSQDRMVYSAGDKSVFCTLKGNTLLESDFTSTSITHSYDGRGYAQDKSGDSYTIALSDLSTSKIPAESGYVVEDLHNGFLRFRKDNLCYFNSYSLSLPEAFTTPSKCIGSGQGRTTLDDFVVDVFQGSTTSPYQFKTFNLH